jgi:hypothetical protein
MNGKVEDNADYDITQSMLRDENEPFEIVFKKMGILMICQIYTTEPEKYDDVPDMPKELRNTKVIRKGQMF